MIKELEDLLGLGPEDLDPESVAEFWLLSEEKRIATERMEQAAEVSVAASLRGDNILAVGSGREFRRQRERLKTLCRLLDEGPKQGTLN